jgi:hypothetical protein
LALAELTASPPAPLASAGLALALSAGLEAPLAAMASPGLPVQLVPLILCARR